MSTLRHFESGALYSLANAADGPLPGHAALQSRRRAATIEDLRGHIRRIEGGGYGLTAAPSLPDGGNSWTLGIEAIDSLLGPSGLDAGGVHEIRADMSGEGAGAAAATASRRAFALLLAVRRLRARPAAPPILWCQPAMAAAETGILYSRGLAALGLDPDRLLIATPRKARDVPWVIEEAMKAGCLSGVIGEVAGLGATAARRLSLAAAEGRTPCVLVSPARAVPVAASATRWRVAPCPSGADRLDPDAPGALRFAIALERCRARPLVSGAIDFAVEWSDVACCFRLVDAVSDRAAAPGRILDGQIAEPGRRHIAWGRSGGG